MNYQKIITVLSQVTGTNFFIRSLVLGDLRGLIFFVAQTIAGMMLFMCSVFVTSDISALLSHTSFFASPTIMEALTLVSFVIMIAVSMRLMYLMNRRMNSWVNQDN